MVARAHSAIRVAQFGGPEVLQVGSSNLPTTLKLGQALIKVYAFGINPAETYVRAGAYAQLPELPYTPGKDFAGIIVEVGEKSVGGSDISANHAQTNDKFKVGTRVFCTGTSTGSYAEMAVVGFEDMHLLPDRMSFSQGAAMGIPFYTAWKALVMKAQAKPGQSLIVLGASGAVGTLILQLAQYLELGVVFGTAGTEPGQAFLKKNYPWLTGVLNHREFGGIPIGDEISTDPPKKAAKDIVNEIEAQLEAAGKTLPSRPVNGFPGFDIVIDMQAQKNLGWFDIPFLAKYGTVVIVGNQGTKESPVNGRAIMQCEGKITGFVGVNPEERAEIDTEMDAIISSNIPRIRPEIGKVFSGLSSTASAHEYIMNREKATEGRVVVAVIPEGKTEL